MSYPIVMCRHYGTKQRIITLILCGTLYTAPLCLSVCLSLYIERVISDSRAVGLLDLRVRGNGVWCGVAKMDIYVSSCVYL